MSEQLSERGKDLVKYMPQAVNALADRLIEKLGERLLYGEKPQTNADRIRAMTDEELEVWLVNLCCASVGDAANARVQIIRGNLLNWLKQEVNE